MQAVEQPIGARPVVHAGARLRRAPVDRHPDDVDTERVELIKPVVVQAGADRADASRDLRASAVDYALLVDDAGRPLGWIRRGDLEGQGPISPEQATPGASLLEPETTLRDALSAMLVSSVQLGAVVDERERVLGLVSVDQISGVLQSGELPVRDDAAG